MVLRNVISGNFQRPGQRDWAVVCSYPNGTGAIVVFWGGSGVRQNTVVDRPAENMGGCWIEIAPAGRDLIMRHHRAYGGPKPPPIDHQGVDEGICEKASITHYFYRGRWLRLTGSD